MQYSEIVEAPNSLESSQKSMSNQDPPPPDRLLASQLDLSESQEASEYSDQSVDAFSFGRSSNRSWNRDPDNLSNRVLIDPKREGPAKKSHSA